MGTKDEVKNAAREVTGHVKEVAGEVTGSEKLEEKGEVEVEEAQADQDEEIAREDRERGQRGAAGTTGQPVKGPDAATSVISSTGETKPSA